MFVLIAVHQLHQEWLLVQFVEDLFQNRNVLAAELVLMEQPFVIIVE